MKPGDLVRVTAPCNSELRKFSGGEIGMIIGWGTTPTGIIRNDLLHVLFPEGLIPFAIHLLETLDEVG
jgi:hypothetical protein